jgi:lysozyme
MARARLKGLLIQHEGMRLKPYKDTVGKISIGIGRCLDDVGISKHEAIMLLENDVATAESLARESFEWFAQISEARQDVIISMIFNVGLSRFFGFKKMLAAMAHADFETAAKEMLASKWAFQVGQRASDLAKMMRVGKYE